MARTERDLLDLLPAYSEGKLADEQVTEIQGLLTGYIDGLLDPETEAAIDHAVETSPSLADDIKKARGGKDILAKIFPPSDELLEDPNSPEIQQLLDDVFAKHANAVQPGEPKITHLPSQKRSHPRVWYALAASIAIMAIGGGAWFIERLQSRLDQALDVQATLQQQIGQLDVERLERQEVITGLDEEIEQLSTNLKITEEERDISAAKRSVLEQQMAGLRSDLETSTERLTAIEGDRSTLAGEVNRLTDRLERTIVARDIAQATLAGAETKQASVDAELTRLSAELQQAEDTRNTAAADFSRAESTIATLRDQQQTLEQQVSKLESDAKTSAAERAALTADAERLQAAISGMRSSRDEAETALAEVEARLAATEADTTAVKLKLAEIKAARQDAEANLAETTATVESLQNERNRLAGEVANLTVEAETQTSELATIQQQLTGLEQDFARVQTNWSDAKRQIVDQAIERAELDRTIAGLHAQKKWTFQVAQYHQLFAQQPKRRWVDAAKNEPERLEALLTDLGSAFGLNRPLPLPNALDQAGLTFMGASQLVINGRSVAQLVYADRQKELFALCIIRNMSGEQKDITRQRFGDDLFLVDWSDQNFQYLVVGYEPIQVVRTLAEQLQQDYVL